jgi:co-chaperonin GroES (HSP10)
MEIAKKFQPIDKYLIKVDSQFKKKFINGVEIYVDNSFNALENAQSVGQIIKEPKSKSKRDKNISIDDFVLIHHFATDNSRKVDIEDDPDGQYFLINASMMFLSFKVGYDSTNKMKDLKAIGPFCILTKPEAEEETSSSGIYLGIKDIAKENEGIVIACCEEFEQSGGKVGDTVMFDKGIDYDLELPDGEKVYRVRCNSIFAVVDGQ